MSETKKKTRKMVNRETHALILTLVKNKVKTAIIAQATGVGPATVSRVKRACIEVGESFEDYQKFIRTYFNQHSLGKNTAPNTTQSTAQPQLLNDELTTVLLDVLRALQNLNTAMLDFDSKLSFIQEHMLIDTDKLHLREQDSQTGNTAKSKRWFSRG